MSSLLLAAKAALEFIQSIEGYENSVTAVNLRREIEAVEHSVQADLAITCDKCSDLAQYPVCACGNPIPRPPNR